MATTSSSPPSPTSTATPAAAAAAPPPPPPPNTATSSAATPQQQQQQASPPQPPQPPWSRSSSPTAVVRSSSISAASPVFRLQLFPHRETHIVNGVHQVVASGCNFAPVERELVIGTVIKLGRRIDKDAKENHHSHISKGHRRTTSRDDPSLVRRPSARHPESAGALPSPTASTPAVESLQSAAYHNDSLSPSSSFRSVSTITARRGLSQQVLAPGATSSPSEDERADSDADGLETFRSSTPDPGPAPQVDPLQTRFASLSRSSVRSRSPRKIPMKSNVVFKSKVVSRDHIEIFVSDDGQIMVRDVGSSSGTFLNRLRLSPSGRESRPYPLKNGDLIQLGVDYHGRQDGRLEDIYKCVMMKVFVSKNTREQHQIHPQRLKVALRAMLAAMNPTASNASDASTTDCCICLSALSSQQSLFLAPCSHCFHYRCVIPLLGSAIMFQCPLCRQVANLDANVTDDLEEEDEIESRESIQALEEWFRGIIDPTLENTNMGKVTDRNAEAASPGLSRSGSTSSALPHRPKAEVPVATLLSSLIRESPSQTLALLEEALAEIPPSKKEDLLNRFTSSGPLAAPDRGLNSSPAFDGTIVNGDDVDPPSVERPPIPAPTLGPAPIPQRAARLHPIATSVAAQAPYGGDGDNTTAVAPAVAPAAASLRVSSEVDQYASTGSADLIPQTSAAAAAAATSVRKPRGGNLLGMRKAFSFGSSGATTPPPPPATTPPPGPPDAAAAAAALPGAGLTVPRARSPDPENGGTTSMDVGRTSTSTPRGSFDAGFLGSFGKSSKLWKMVKDKR